LTLLVQIGYYFFQEEKVEVIFFAIQKDKIQVPLKKEKKQTPPDNHTGI
jgi:hypothetical protein